MGRMLRLLAAAATMALLGVGQAQAYDEDDDYFYSYRTRPIVYHQPYYHQPYYHQPYYRPAYQQYYRRPALPPGTLPGVGERTHDRTGTLPGVTPRYNDRHYRPYNAYHAYNSYGYYGRPSTCGRYHYARGGYCADARWSPPFKRYYPIYRYVTIVEYDYY